MRLLYILFLISFSIVYSQHLKVEYERIDLKDLDYDNTLSKEYREKVNAERKKPQKLFLYYADGYSFFKSIPRNSIVHNAGDKKENDVTTHKREVFKDNEVKIYHNKNENGIYGYHNYPDINEEFYGYMDTKYATIEYKNETIIIDKYLCKLVEVTFDFDPTIFKIWYTEDLPISAGPAAFNTFPGLVLRIENPQYTMTAVKISNEAKPTDVEKINPKLRVYKNEEYTKKLKEIEEQRSKPTFEEIKL